MLPEINKLNKISILRSEKIESSTAVAIHTINTPSQDVVRVSLVFCCGVKYQTKAFVASSTANLLTEGCGEMSALEVSSMLDFYGIYYDVTVDRDYTVITICSLGKFAAKAISLLEKIVLEPKFLESECEVYTSKRKASLKIEREKMNVRSREEFVRSIFGKEHDYAQFSSANDYDMVKSDDLKEFYAKFYNRSNLFVVMSGNITSEMVEGVKTICDKLPEGSLARKVTITNPVETTIKRVENAESVQTSLNIGRSLFSRNHPDFVAMQVTSTILGGYFSSRLMQNLREENGFTYGVHSATVNLQDSGYFIISSELVKEHTDDAIEQIFYEIELLQSELVDDDELDMVKRVITGEVLRILDGPFGIADVTIENIQNGTTNSATEESIKEINSVTKERVREMAQKYLRREDLNVVVYC